MPFLLAWARILDAVDQVLRVFDTNANRKGLWLQSNALGVENPINIAGAMSSSQNNSIPDKFSTIARTSPDYPFAIR